MTPTPPPNQERDSPIALTYLYDISLPSTWAAAIQILNTCHSLATLGVPTTVYVRSLARDTAECLASYDLKPLPNFKVLQMPSHWRWRLPWPWPIRSPRSDDGRRTHIVMSRGDSALKLSSLLRSARRRHALVVYEAHRLSFAHEIERQSGQKWNGSVPRRGPIRRLYETERTTVGTADGIVCLTDDVRDALTREFRLTAPVLVLPSGTRVAQEPPDGAALRDIDVIYAGKLMTRKGIPLLMDAMRYLPGRSLVVLGGSPEEVDASRSLLRGEDLQSRIDFKGFVEPRQVPTYLARARVGVCPLPPGVSITSERFTSSLKVLELMAAGTPVVACDLPSMRSMLTHGETGWLVPAGDPDALAVGIRTLLEDRALADRLATAARERVRAFSWTERARQLRGFLEKLASHTSTAAARADYRG